MSLQKVPDFGFRFFPVVPVNITSRRIVEPYVFIGLIKHAVKHVLKVL